MINLACPVILKNAGFDANREMVETTVSFSREATGHGLARVEKKRPRETNNQNSSKNVLHGNGELIDFLSA